MPEEPVRFYNPKTGRVEEESIYGGRALRWTYGSPLGKLSLWAAVRRRWASVLYGRKMANPASRKKIAPFIREFGINTSELAEKPENFSCFDAFFTRALRQGARPLAEGEKTLVFPADGRHLIIPDLREKPDIFVKNKAFPLARFLGGAPFAERYQGGAMVICRLCPVDYHRVHFPCAGLPLPPRWITGHYYSVNPIALKARPSLFAENQRCVTEMDTNFFGRLAVVEVAATFVGSIIHTHPARHPARKGDEKGWFRFGGSTVALVFEPGRVRFDPVMAKKSAEGLETYALMGERLGTAAAD